MGQRLGIHKLWIHVHRKVKLYTWNCKSPFIYPTFTPGMQGGAYHWLPHNICFLVSNIRISKTIPSMAWCSFSNNQLLVVFVLRRHPSYYSVVAGMSSQNYMGCSLHPMYFCEDHRTVKCNSLLYTTMNRSTPQKLQALISVWSLISQIYELAS